MNSASRIAIILPPRERFRVQDAGAVALTIKDFYVESVLKQELVVFGGFAEHFPDIMYQHVKLSFWKVAGKNFAYAKACIQNLRQSQIQLVEVHNRVKLAMRIKAAMPHLKVTAYLHNDPHSMNELKTAQERARLLEHLDLVYCVSEFVKARLLEGVNLSLASRAQVIYNAIPSSVVQQPQDRRPWIVYAGRFVPQKGVLELAQSLAQVLPQFPGWKVVFLGAKGFGHQVGKSKYEQSVYAELTHVADQVEFRGHVSHDEVMITFSQASIAVTPSIDAEAFGRTTLEAMDMGCAVISAVCGGLKEVAGDAAIVINPVNLTTLSDAITLLIRDGSLRQTCATHCQQYVRASFSLAEQVRRLDKTRHVLMQASA